jgi:diketogulonate reductase-like aldo/keto reductase
MAGLVGDGRLRTAGVSNFEPARLDRIVCRSTRRTGELRPIETA